MRINELYILSAILCDLEKYQEILDKGPESLESLVDSENAAFSSGIGGGGSGAGTNASHWRKRMLQKVQSALISSLEIGDEKLQLVQSMQDVVENKSRQLDANCSTLGQFVCLFITVCKAFAEIITFTSFTEFNKDNEPVDAKETVSSSKDNAAVGVGGSSSGGNAGSGGERQSKRARRMRNESVAPPANFVRCSLHIAIVIFVCNHVV